MEVAGEKQGAACERHPNYVVHMAMGTWSYMMSSKTVGLKRTLSGYRHTS